MVVAHTQFFRVASLLARQNIEKSVFGPFKITPGPSKKGPGATQNSKKRTKMSKKRQRSTQKAPESEKNTLKSEKCANIVPSWPQHAQV